MIVLDHAKYFFKIRILAGICFYTFIRSFLYEPVWHILTGMKDSGTTVVSLFFMFWTAQDPIYKSDHRIAVYRCPPPIISTIMGINLFIIKMFLRHMAVICDI